MERATSKFMKMAKQQLMLKQAPSSSISMSETAVRMMERSTAMLRRLITICNGGPRRNLLKFNHALCRLLDLQGFHDNIRNLLDEIATLAAVEREGCTEAAREIWRVTINAEALVAAWMSESSGQDQWMISAISHASDGGMTAGQQNHEQQWCVAIMEVVLAQFRVARSVDGGKSKRNILRREEQIPFWMVDRTFEIGEEYLSMDEDRGLAMAVRFDRRRLLDRLKRRMHRTDGLFLRGIQSILLTSSRLEESKRQEFLLRYLSCKLEGDEDSRIESYIERFYQERPLWGKVKHLDENLELLGMGTFGTVYRSNWLGIPAAVKKITAISCIDDFWNEIAVLADARHPRIAQTLFASVNEDDENGDCLLWTELLGSDLDTILNKEGALDLGTALSILLQVAEGMAYLHRKGVLHRSLKASNVLFVPAKKSQVQINIPGRNVLHDFARVRITDFGLPTTKEAAAWQNMQENLPRYWVAPEALDAACNFSKKSDVYSFGMLAHHILTGHRPFRNAMDDPDLIRIVHVEGERPSIQGVPIPPYLTTLLTECWNSDPRARPSFDGICCYLRSFKALLIRCGERNLDWKSLGPRLPFTPSDFANLRDRLGGLRFFVEAIAIARMKDQGEYSLFDNDDQKASFPFPMDSFVLWLASCVDHLERDEGFATAAEIAGDYVAAWTGSKHDFDQAVFWYHKAAVTGGTASGSLFSPGSARWKLGICVEDGFGITKDEKRAFELYHQSAREGFSSAHIEIGRCYQAGKGVEMRNIDKAAAHFAKAQDMFEVSMRGKSDSNWMMAGIEFLMRILATASLEEDCSWAADRLHEVAARSRIGRMIVAGRHCCNVRELVGMLGDWRVQDAGRKRAKLILERLGMEDDIFHEALLT